jgi:hypothetical protein
MYGHAQDKYKALHVLTPALDGSEWLVCPSVTSVPNGQRISQNQKAVRTACPCRVSNPTFPVISFNDLFKARQI